MVKSFKWLGINEGGEKIIQVEKLRNGLTVVFEEKQEPLTVVLTSFNTGSLQEEKNEKGSTHFLEHILLKWSRKGKKTPMDLVGETGGFLGGTTSYVNMQLSGYVLKKYYPKLLDVETGMVSSPVITEEGVEKEKNVILRELALKMERESFGMNVFKNILPFDEKTIGLGTEKDIKNMTVSKLEKRLKRIRAANNMTVVMTGGFEKGKALDLLEDKLGFVRKKKLKKKNIRLKKPGRVVVNEKKLKQSKIALSFASPLCKEKEYYSFILLFNYLRRVIHKELGDKQNKVYSIKRDYRLLPNKKIFSIYTSLKPSDEGIVEKEFKRQIERIRQGKINNKLLAGMKKEYEVNTYKSMQDLRERAKTIAKKAATGRLENYAKSLDIVKRTTAKDLADLANDYLAEDKQYWFTARPAGV